MTVTTANMLELEAHHQLWESTAQGVHLWALIRIAVFTAVIFRENQYQAPPKEDMRMYVSPRRWWRYLRTLALLASPRRGRFGALFVVTDLSRYAAEGTEHTIDRTHGALYDLLYELKERPLILESSPKSTLPKPDVRHRGNQFSHDLIWLLSILGVRLVRLSPSVESAVTAFAQKVSDLFDLPDQRDEWIELMLRLLKQARFVDACYRWLLAPKLKKRIAFVEDASYMGGHAVRVKILHELGFQVIELQHGLINPQAPAYRMAVEIAQIPQHPCRAYLPDTILTYGDYWSGVIQTPNLKVPVGSPTLSQAVAQAYGQPVQAGQILVVSQYTVTEKAIDAANRLAQAFPEQRVLFKLHPLELHLERYCQKRMSAPNLLVIGRQNIYSLIAQSGIIVGYSSTALIEAAAYPNKRIFYNELSAFPDGIGHHFTDAGHLVTLIRTLESIPSKTDPNLYWADHWEKRLRDFMQWAWQGNDSPRRSDQPHQHR